MIEQEVLERATEVFNTNASWYKDKLVTNDTIPLARYVDVFEWLPNNRSVVTDIYVNDTMVYAMQQGDYRLRVSSWDSRCVRGCLVDEKGKELQEHFYSWSYEWLAPPQQMADWEVII